MKNRTVTAEERLSGEHGDCHGSPDDGCEACDLEACHLAMYAEEANALRG